MKPQHLVAWLTLLATLIIASITAYVSLDRRVSASLDQRQVEEVTRQIVSDKTDDKLSEVLRWLQSIDKRLDRLEQKP